MSLVSCSDGAIWISTHSENEYLLQACRRLVSALKGADISVGLDEQ